jgi:hypothetical protein
MHAKVRRLSVWAGILAFVGLAVLNFTKSETTFAQKAMASSTDGSTTASCDCNLSPNPRRACKETGCEYRILNQYEIYKGVTDKCLDIHDPEAIGWPVSDGCNNCRKGCIPVEGNQQ